MDTINPIQKLISKSNCHKKKWNMDKFEEYFFFKYSYLIPLHQTLFAFKIGNIHPI